MSLKIDKEKMNKLYALEKYGVPRTHLECLMWFDVNKGKGVDADTLKGKRVPGRMPDKTVKGITKKGFPYQARYPIPANNIVSKPHYLHAGVRGSYKPAGEEIVGYDDKKRKAIWEGGDTFVQAIQTGNGNLGRVWKRNYLWKNGIVGQYSTTMMQIHMQKTLTLK